MNHRDTYQLSARERWLITNALDIYVDVHEELARQLNDDNGGAKQATEFLRHAAEARALKARFIQ